MWLKNNFVYVIFYLSFPYQEFWLLPYIKRALERAYNKWIYHPVCVLSKMREEPEFSTDTESTINLHVGQQ
jgi:hypothetical protein